MADKDWVKVFETGKEYEIEMVKDMLLEDLIESVVMNKKDSAYLFGYFELYVTRENIMRARTLIEGAEL